MSKPGSGQMINAALAQQLTGGCGKGWNGKRSKHCLRTAETFSDWRHNRNTIEFIGIWEQINNSGFNPIEFDGFRKEARQHRSIELARQRLSLGDGGEVR